MNSQTVQSPARDLDRCCLKSLIRQLYSSFFFFPVHPAISAIFPYFFCNLLCAASPSSSTNIFCLKQQFPYIHSLPRKKKKKTQTRITVYPWDSLKPGDLVLSAQNSSIWNPPWICLAFLDWVRQWCILQEMTHHTFLIKSLCWILQPSKNAWNKENEQLKTVCMLFPPKLFKLMRNSLHSNSNHLKHQFLVLAWVQLARDFEKETKQYSRNPAQQPALKHANMPHFPTYSRLL